MKGTAIYENTQDTDCFDIGFIYDTDMTKGLSMAVFPNGMLNLYFMAHPPLFKKKLPQDVLGVSLVEFAQAVQDAIDGSTGRYNSFSLWKNSPALVVDGYEDTVWFSMMKNVAQYQKLKAPCWTVAISKAQAAEVEKLLLKWSAKLISAEDKQ